MPIRSTQMILEHWRVTVAFLASAALNGFLLVVAFSINSKEDKLSRIERIANALLKPAASLTEQLAPGHGGAQILALILFSILVYTVLVWVVLSLPRWWRHRT